MSERTFKAWRIEKHTAGGCEKSERVYLSQTVANLVASQPHDEFETYVPVEVTMRPLGKTEGVVGREVVTVDNSTEAEYHRRTGMAKLTENEKAALGL